jgi:RsmE family RNA methyltransferase
VNDGRVRLSGRRLRHVREVLKARKGDELTVGMAGGNIGTGTLTRLDEEFLEMDVLVEREPPAALPLTVVLALPRPKVLRRVLHSLAVLGVKRIILMNAARVEKSYWQSPFLAPESIRHQLVLGLEQAADTVLPEVTLRPLFRPFVEDELPGIANGTVGLVAHPGEQCPLPSEARRPVTLSIGPEGGFVPFELDMLCSLGLSRVSFGPRKLNVETAVCALIGRLMP